MGLTRKEKARREAAIVKETARDTDIPATMGGLREIELPEVRTLPELFSEMRPRPIRDLARPERRPGEYFCSSYVTDAYWNVVPSPAVQKILDQMQQRLGLSFDIVMRRSGTALICVKYDRIIGGRWLAIIDGAKVRTASKQGGA
ncbi:hypothetical protein LCGC14_2051540 [marine sediment metagenome]|uniref:Uncharacterized protein n=1 Tax=marine sediment metagenome TaxID=412755 RepID=A0A0F9FBC3_9ZZZZ